MLADLKNKAVTQAIETIRNRIDSLGVSEPTIQEHGLGQYQILVQLPGVDDPARVKDIMQSTAMLEIKQVSGRTVSRASRRRCRIRAAFCRRTRFCFRATRWVVAPKASSGIWFRASRPSAEKTCATPQPSPDQNGQSNVDFQLTGEGGQRFFNFTSAHVNDSLGVVLDNKVQEVANINEPIRDQGEISGHMDEQQSKDLSMILHSGALPAGIKYSKSARWDRRWARIRFAPACGPLSSACWRC